MNYNLIQNSKFKIQNSRKAFTLIELMVAIAIVGILAAVVLVSMKGFGVKARSAKALAQLSSAIPSMVSCWGNGYAVKAPEYGGGGAICKQKGSGGADVAGYGNWSTAGSETGLTNMGYYSDISDITDQNGWWVSLQSDRSGDGILVCCNSAMHSCVAVDPAAPPACHVSRTSFCNRTCPVK